jgi:putative addiction module CopG family antidote
MTIPLRPELKRFVNEQVKAGKYRSAADVVEEALTRLMLEPPDDFEPGELNEMIAEGEASLARDGGQSLEEVFGRLARRSAAYRKSMNPRPSLRS